MTRVLVFLTAIASSALFGHAGAQSVTLYTAGPEGLAKNIAKSFTDKTGIKVDVYQATSGEELAGLGGEKGKPRALENEYSRETSTFAAILKKGSL